MYHNKSKGGLSKGMWQIAAATVANHKVSFLNVIAGTDFAYEAPFLVIGKSSHSTTSCSALVLLSARAPIAQLHALHWYCSLLHKLCNTSFSFDPCHDLPCIHSSHKILVSLFRELNCSLAPRPSQRAEDGLVFRAILLVTWGGAILQWNDIIAFKPGTWVFEALVHMNYYVAPFTKAWHGCRVYWDSWKQAARHV